MIIELLLMAQLAQLPPSIRYNPADSIGCPDFTLAQNNDIVIRANRDYQSKGLKGGISIYYLMPFVTFMSVDFPWDNRPDPRELARIDRLVEFINQQIIGHKYVFFCPDTDSNVLPFNEQSIDFINRTFSLGARNAVSDDFARRLNMVAIDNVHKGRLFYVLPFSN